ncbi:MAG TPA: glycosyltransferase [Pyrinomonadaceae bacterium]
MPPSLKLFVKRAFVGAVGFGVRAASRVADLGRRVLDAAARRGLDLGAISGINPRPAVEPFGVHDFLLMARRASGDNPPQPPDKPPLASVIIPVFNKVEYTFQCLRSLMREVDLKGCEVIVVNNASSDETLEVLSHFAGLVRVINNEENLGFVEACNRGAAEARGKYLVFLNNDTVVLPGWLKHLLDTAERDETVGAVGSMLLHPDGRIQEAGAIVWRNGAALHYGRGKSPGDRRFTFAREVDYCSGASLLVRKEVFDRLGGFDRHFAPAYYEDVDLCFGVRSLGYKVVYQPASRLIHYEGVTAGTDAQAGYKRFQVINRGKFFEKWRGVLERDQQEEDPARAGMAADRRRGPRVIVFDDRVPTPDRDAGSARMAIILETLAKWARPVFVYFSQAPSPEYERVLWKAGVETIAAVHYRGLMKERRFDLAVVSRPEVAETVLGPLRRDGRVKIIFDTVDARFVRLKREAEITGDRDLAEAGVRYRKLEGRLARASDQLWCASAEDKKAMSEFIPAERIEVVTTIHPLRGRGRPYAERDGLLFVGNLHHRPNSDGVHYFVKEIFPLVREAVPGIKLAVVGANVSPEIAAHGSEDVDVKGYVPDIEPLFQAARVFVAPVRFGAGIKGKIGDAMSYGLPVVTTSVGAEGFGITDGEEALIADGPREFAEAVIRVYRERGLWQRLSDKGYRHIEESYTPRAVGEIINAAVRRLLQKDSSTPHAP